MFCHLIPPHLRCNFFLYARVLLGKFFFEFLYLLLIFLKGWVLHNTTQLKTRYAYTTELSLSSSRRPRPQTRSEPKRAVLISTPRS